MLFLWQSFIYPAGDFSPSGVFSWRISDDLWDKRLLRNRMSYLVEGAGGCSVLLGESVERARAILGRPTRRSFGGPDRLFYRRRTANCDITAYRGNIVKIRYHVQPEKPPSLHWNFALGLRAEDLGSMGFAQAREAILKHYDPPQYLVKPDVLMINSRGISFIWNKERLAYIEIYKPWLNY